MSDFDFIGPDEKPALIGISNPDIRAACETILAEQGYKVHAADDHQTFLERFRQLQYEVVILEETFGGIADGNESLTSVQRMAMNLRRHAFIALIGESFETMDSRQAYAQSVHVVVNSKDVVTSFGQILMQRVAENQLFLKMFRDVQLAVMQGK